MNTTVNKYLWQFFRLFFIGYLIGLVLIFVIDAHWHNPILRDIFILCLLSSLLPYYLAIQFIKQEGRFFTTEEQAFLVKKTTLIAFGISMLPTVFFISLKLWMHTFEITYTHFFGTLLMNIIFYYSVLRLIIQFRFKRARHRYEQKHCPTQDAVNDRQ